MTAFAPTDLPPGITSVEQLKMWCDCLLEELYGGQTYKEASGSAIDSGLAPLIDTSIVSAADGTKREITRSAIELNPDYRFDKTRKHWMFAEPMGTAAIPATFKID